MNEDSRIEAVPLALNARRCKPPEKPVVVFEFAGWAPRSLSAEPSASPKDLTGLSFCHIIACMAVRPNRIGKFGDLVRAHRKRLNLTMNELARRIDMDQGLLSKIERGVRPPPQIVPGVQRIAEALQLQPGSPEFKELLNLAGEERFGKKKWPGIVSLTLDDRGLPLVIHHPVVPRGLSGYEPPESRETLHPGDPRYERIMGQRSDDPPPDSGFLNWAKLDQSPVFAPSDPAAGPITSQPYQIDTLLSMFASVGVSITRFQQESTGFTLEFRLADGTEYVMTVSPKVAPSKETQG